MTYKADLFEFISALSAMANLVILAMNPDILPGAMAMIMGCMSGAIIGIYAGRILAAEESEEEEDGSVD